MEYLKIGKIVNTRGIKGELKIQSMTDFQSDRYHKGNSVFIHHDDKYLEFKVKSCRNIKNQDILVFEDYEDINMVEKFKGCDIFVSDMDETTLYEDEYHISEIIGLDVYQKNNLVGEIHDVRAYPQGDYLEIIDESGKKSLVPFRDEFVTEVNLEEGYVEIIEMEGLI